METHVFLRLSVLATLLVCCACSADEQTLAACAAGEALDGHGACAPRCDEDAPCPHGLYCDTAVSVCRAPQSCAPSPCQPDQACIEDEVDGPLCLDGARACQDDADCDFVDACVEHLCTSRLEDVADTCDSSDDCDAGMECSLGLCFGCDADTDCRDGATCVLGTCVEIEVPPAPDLDLGCVVDGCPGGMQCVATTGACVPGCASDGECAAGEFCAPLLNRCIADFGCADDGDCQGGLQCTLGVCLGCGSDAECQAGEQCLLGACLPRLEDNNLCAAVTCDADHSCDPFDGSCYPSDGSCGGDADCRTGQTCSGLVNICTGCASDANCRPAQRCILTACIPIQ